jgi:hypothetical protein
LVPTLSNITARKSHRGIPCRTTFSPVFIHWGIPNTFLGINQTPLASPIQLIPNFFGKKHICPHMQPCYKQNCSFKKGLIHPTTRRDTLISSPRPCEPVWFFLSWNRFIDAAAFWLGQLLPCFDPSTKLLAFCVPFCVAYTDDVIWLLWMKGFNEYNYVSRIRVVQNTLKCDLV